jgi:hypothetical protein
MGKNDETEDMAEITTMVTIGAIPEMMFNNLTNHVIVDTRRTCSTLRMSVLEGL